jgi:hypothetical protein
MSFGKRGIVPSSNTPAPHRVWKEYFIHLSSKRLDLFTKWGIQASPNGERSGSFAGIVYPLSWLALGIALGGSLGATLAPQLLHAEGAGIYDFIHLNDAVMRARHQATPPPPRPRLPQLSIRPLRGRANVMQARLPPAQFAPEHRHLHRVEHHPLAVVKPAPEIGPRACANCELARYGSALEAILHDETLRPGDTVMMSFGAMVFQGGEHPPYTAADFTDFRKSTLLTKKERKLIDDELGLTRRAELMRDFASSARAPRTSSEVARSGGHTSVGVP